LLEHETELRAKAEEAWANRVTCPHCGTVQPLTQTCGACGKSIPACGFCGKCEACGYGQV
jgi:hypothetical protein